MTIAMERLAVLAPVTLPVTAVASIYGMNVIVNDSTHWRHLFVVLLAMAAIRGVPALDETPGVVVTNV
ncbi:MAG TPA: CorA family divalent cation transporter [Ilumatobacteraceae bacterium]|nr:CorA family divalent cation transporter [Ilumatobacteraceae bacterium]